MQMKAKIIWLIVLVKFCNNSIYSNNGISDRKNNSIA